MKQKKTLKNVKKDDLKLTEEDLLENKTDEVSQLYHALKNKVKSEFDDVGCKILVDEISFKINNKIICNVKFLKKTFNVHFFSQKIKDDKKKLRNISKKGTGGKANNELKVDSENDLEYFMELFKEVYSQKVKQ